MFKRPNQGYSENYHYRIGKNEIPKQFDKIYEEKKNCSFLLLYLKFFELRRYNDTYIARKSIWFVYFSSFRSCVIRFKKQKKKKKTLLRCWTWEKCKLTTTMARSMWMRSFYFIYFLLFISYNQLCGLRRYRCNGMRIYMYGLQERYKEEEKTHAVIATQLNANEENKERKR